MKRLEAVSRSRRQQAGTPAVPALNLTVPSSVALLAARSFLVLVLFPH